MFVRVQSTNTPGKAKKLRKELERSHAVTGAVTIARLGEDDYRIISEMRLVDIAHALMAAAHGVTMAQGKEDARDAEVRVDHSSNEPMPHERLGRRRNPEVRQDPDGTLHAPAGETFIFCAECGAARWFLTQLEYSLGPFARCVCVSCGNELKFVTASAPESRA